MQECECRDCSGPFSFTKGEQDCYKEKGFDIWPTRCKDCRAAKKARFEGEDGGGAWSSGAVGVCYAFQSGSCDRGDACRFSHDADAAAASPSKGKGKGKDKGKGKGKGGGGVCYAFQRGECTYGDSCRFEHKSE